MSEGHNLSWLRAALLMGALIAGVLTTQLVPTYKDAERTVTYKTKSPTATKSNNSASHGVSGVDAKLRQSKQDRGTS